MLLHQQGFVDYVIRKLELDVPSLKLCPKSFLCQWRQLAERFVFFAKILNFSQGLYKTYNQIHIVSYWCNMILAWVLITKKFKKKTKFLLGLLSILCSPIKNVTSKQLHFVEFLDQITHLRMSTLLWLENTSSLKTHICLSSKHSNIQPWPVEEH